LFVVFSGKKQPKFVGNCQKLKKFKSEVMTTFFKKFRQNPQILKSRVSVSNFKSRSRSFWWSLGLSRTFNQVSKVTVLATSLTTTHLHSSNFTSQVKQAKNQSQILTGNLFHVTLCIVCLYILFKNNQPRSTEVSTRER